MVWLFLILAIVLEVGAALSLRLATGGRKLFYIAVVVGYLVVGHNQGWSLGKRGSVLDSALPDVAVIVFVTGAGGVFANVLVTSGIGAAFSEALIAINMPIII